MEFSKNVEKIAYVLNLTNESIRKESWSSSTCEFTVWDETGNVGTARFTVKELQVGDKTLGLIVPVNFSWNITIPLNVVFQKVTTFDFVNTFKSKKELAQAVYTKIRGLRELPELYQEVSNFFEKKNHNPDFGRISICTNDYFGKLSLVTILFHTNNFSYEGIYYKLIETDKPFSDFY